MKSLLSTIIILAFFALFSCKNSNSTTVPTIVTNPLSTQDPKVGLSPEERFGALFDSVQMSGLFPDFIDYVPLIPTDNIMAAFKEASAKPDFSLQSFVNQHFSAPKNFANSLSNDPSVSPEQYITSLWATLKRAADTADLSTKIPLPKSYVVQSGGANELRYWDSYFAMLGLKASGRLDLVENMIDNFAYLINTVGYVPSGTRTYYLSRSQPPFFTCMVELLADSKGDEILVKYVDAMEKEYNFWMEGAEKDVPRELFTKRRVLHLDRNTLNRYRDDKDTPRPENYKADKDSAKNSIRSASETYRHLRSSAESGWEASSRWLENPQKLSTIHTCDIVPVDLNALLYHMEWTISRAKGMQKKIEEATDWEKRASRRREALMRYCWNSTKGLFFDFDFNRYKQKEVISAATIYPLVFRMVTKKDADKVAQNIRTHLLKAGGIVATTHKTGLNWDAPYGSAPLQWMAIRGLRNYGQDELAEDIKNRWVSLNVEVFKSTGKLMEKYNVEDRTGSNEASQDGFGWTNGVLLKLLMENNL